MNSKASLHKKISEEKEKLLDEKRREGLSTIENQLSGKVITYIAHFQAEKGIIEYQDEKAFQDLLNTLGFQKRMNLILHSKGGDLDRAEKIISLLRNYCEKLVTLPLNAKSAATVICFGADKIIMGPGSELGPINPLVPWRDPKTGEREWRPASSFVEGLEKIEKSISEEKRPIELYLPLLRGVDYAFVERCRMVTERSKTLAKELLKNHLLSSLSYKEFKNRFQQIKQEFLEVSSHDKVIDGKKAEKTGLPVKILEPESELFKNVLEYRSRALHFLVDNNLAKIVETSK